MSIIQGNAHTSAGGGGYQIERSLRFNSADSAYLNRTPASAGNRRTFTWSGWVKRGIIGSSSYQYFFSASSELIWGFEGDAFRIQQMDGSGNSIWNVQSTQLFRDPSAWYHIVIAIDTTQATASDRVKLYVNGVQVTAFSISSYPTQNYDTSVNTAAAHNIGRSVRASAYYFDGYLTEVNFVDGQALTPSSFGETDSNTGVWKPKAFSGTYGTNGFYLKFADNSGTTSTTLGKDSSGNGNNWTPNNFSVTAGAGNDSLVDSPTSYGTDTGVGGTVRGNYCTWNPLSTGRTLSNGNLDYAGSASGVAKGTLGVSSGKWYWEILANGANSSAGVASVSLNPTTSYCGSTADSWCLFTSGDRYNNGSATSGYSTFTTNDIISIALDMDNGKVYWAKNGVWQGSSNPATGTNAGYTNLSGYTITPANGNNNTNDLGTANFGQRAFAYTAPSGFKALCTQNLPTPTIGATSTTQANDYFNVVTYTGNGTAIGSGGLTVSGVGFKPDFVWGKRRDTAAYHGLVDSIRGGTKLLFSNSTDAETTYSEGISTFNADGFTVGNLGNFNTLNGTYVAWNWNAGGSNATNTSGTITSTVRANTTSGFSIVTYTGTGSAATVGHGLGVAPSLIIVKARTQSAARNWKVYSSVLGAGQTINFNEAAAAGADTTIWNNTSPTSTVFSVGASNSVNENTYTYVAYCFAPVAGYSAFGSYTGNGSTDGPFVFTNFRPRYILWKVSSGTTGHWEVVDTARETYNQSDQVLFASSSGAESAASSSYYMDILSNGFKIRNTDTSQNGNTYTYIYACFAENPFKYSLAR